MNQQQREYARERITRIKESRISAIREGCLIRESQDFDVEGWLAHIEQEGIIIRDHPTVRKSRYGSRTAASEYDILDLFEIPEEFTGNEIFDMDRFSKEKAEVEKAASLAVDQAMLGSDSEALKIIEEFANAQALSTKS